MISFSGSQRAAVEAVYAALGPPRLRYCRWTPTARQEAFLLLPQREAFFGGAAGPGKSVALLMAALQYADVPGYAALLLRPTLAELEQPGALIDLAHEFLDGSAGWNGERRRWLFPGPGRRSGADGATLNFGYLGDDNDPARYAGASYTFLGLDELTQFTEDQYRRMFRVLRQANDPDGRFPAAPDGTRLQHVPLRIRSASNPGGPGHSWVKARFVDPVTRPENVGYLPARLTDNPYLDSAAYAEVLAELPRLEQLRLLHGDWDITEEGEKFSRDWFPLVSPAQVDPAVDAVRYWDFAATEVSARNRDPDYTVGLLLELSAKGIFTIRDIVRGRWNGRDVEAIVRRTARSDGVDVPVYIEQEPGAAGKLLLSHFQRTVLRGYACQAGLSGGADKELRSRPVAAAACNGLVQILPTPHLHSFLAEIAIFPNGSHDDLVDALSGAHAALTPKSRVRILSIHNPNKITTPYSLGLAREAHPAHGRVPADELATLLGINTHNRR